MNKITTLVAAIAICLVFAGLYLNSSSAQSADKFLTYTNNDLKFSIQHPSNWKVKVDYLQFTTQGVMFQIPDRLLNSFAVYIEKVEPYLDTDTMALQNTSLEQRVQKELNGNLSTNDVKIIRQNEVTVGGNTGWKIEYSKAFPSYSEYRFEIFTIFNGKFYKLSYSDDSLKVPETLPLANKMVESFQIK